MAKLILARLTEEDKKNFWSKVNIGEHDECWLWTASCFVGGYGQFSPSSPPLRAHRVSWSLTHKQEIPKGMLVLHKCDVRHCVNPQHLFIGTHTDNMRDMSSKERSRSTKLTEEKIKTLRSHVRNRKLHTKRTR